ncbi:MAG: carboxypeptidase-like regulatory domain-containing protein [Bacteroidota bacterium]
MLNTTVSGVVTDYKTGKPLANIKVELLELIIYGYGGDKSDPISSRTAFTDANGKYSFKYKSSKNKKVNSGLVNFFDNNIMYVISINDNPFYSYTKNIYDVENKNSKMYEANATLTPLTYIKYKYKNVAPFNDNDKLLIVNAFEDVVYFEINGGNIEGITEPIVCEIDNVNELLDYRVFWKVSGNQSAFKQIVKCPIGDTTQVEINY